MDFEVKYEKIEINDATLFARSNLWLLKVLMHQMALDFDSRLTNRLRLLTSCLNEVKFDISSLINAKIITRTNSILKRSLGSLLMWLYEFLDSRPILMSENGAFLHDLNSKIISQLKIFPSVFCAVYYDSNSTTSYFAQIRLSSFNTGRLDHILTFSNTIDEYNNQSGTFPLYDLFSN